jgi:DNA polymerase III delta prime subunit
MKIVELLLSDKNKILFEKFTTENSIPHLIFSGPPGTGKTTAAYALAEVLLQDSEASFLELNASDERGVEVVRTTIFNFARTNSLTDPVKILLLEECEAITAEAQMCLRRILEVYFKNFRVIFTTNNIHKIDAAIRSRCLILDFPPVNSILAHQLLSRRGIPTEDRLRIIDSFTGDMRTLNQSVDWLNSREESPELLSEFTRAREFSQINSTADLVCSKYGSQYKILCQDLLEILISLQECTQRMNYIVFLAELEFNLIRGGSLKINLLSFKQKIGDLL